MKATHGSACLCFPLQGWSKEVILRDSEAQAGLGVGDYTRMATQIHVFEDVWSFIAGLFRMD